MKCKDFNCPQYTSDCCDKCVTIALGYREFVRTAKERGFIRKSAVEKAEIVTFSIGTFFSENDEPYVLSIEEFNTMYNAIQELKSEIERLKK